MSGRSRADTPAGGRLRWLWIAVAVLVFGVALSSLIVAKGCVRGGKRSDGREGMPGFCLRAGLPNLRVKLRAGKPVHLAFLGGSITQNAGNNGFVKALPEWIRSNYPGSPVSTTNAGMAATGSDWGAKRVGRDVLANNPDLVFVEFAVNDGARDSISDMEQIVRKTLHSNPEAELVFLYTTSDGAFKQTTKGKTPKAIQNHEQVARHYGIPSVTLGSDLRKRLLSGESNWGDLFMDSCHPTEQGYDSYNRDLIMAFEKILSGGDRDLRKFPGPMSDVGEGPLPKRVPIRQRAPIPLRNTEGLESVGTEEMPDLGTEWIDVPRFPPDGPPVWRLRYGVFPEGLPSQYGVAGADTDWPMARWFEEAACFTGSNSRVLASATPEGGSSLSVAAHGLGGGVEVPEVLWTARHSGNYRVVVHVKRTSGQVVRQPASAGLEFAVFRGGKVTREAVKIPLTAAKESSGWEMDRTVDLKEGDQIHFRLFGEGLEYFSLDGLRIFIGQFPSQTGG